MANALTLYIQNTFVLAKTIVAKHSMLADASNKDLIRRGYPVDPSNPRSWRYYMNLSGQYHQYDKDTLSKLSAELDETTAHEYMQVFVAGEEGAVQVDFTAELISGPNADPATAAEYRYGQPFFNELLGRYPSLETLILGIINPVDIDLAISAHDGEILYCGGYQKTPMLNGKGYFYQKKAQSVFDDSTLLEENEEQVIPALQHCINAYCTRWINHDFIKIDDLYVQFHWGNLFAHMVSALLNIRHAAAHSSKANSFHVSAFLEGHGYLGSINQHLPLSVVMWMYRNVMWLEANLGKQLTLDAIINNVFTPCSVPISKYILKHDNSILPENNMPQTFGYAVPLNLGGAGIVQQEAHTIAELLAKELPLARDNGYDLEGDADNVQFTSSRGRAAEYGTKLLESVLVDYSNFIPYKLEDVLLNMWAYGVAKGSYQGTAYVTHPLSGDRLQFTMRNAFILMVYCYNKGYRNHTLENIQPVTVRMIPREVSYVPAPGFTTRPTFAELRGHVDPYFVKDKHIINMIGTRNPIYSFNNSSNFHNECYSQWAEMNRQFYLHDHSPWLTRSLYLEKTMRRLYWTGLKLDLPDTGDDYVSWFTRMNLNLDGCDSNDYLNLMTQLFKYGTGFNNNGDRDLTSMQETCIQILNHFTSYSTHIVVGRGFGAPEFTHDTPTKIDFIEMAVTEKFYIPQVLPDVRTSFSALLFAETGHEDTLDQENITLTSELNASYTDSLVGQRFMGGQQTIFVPLVNVDNNFHGIVHES